MATSFVSASRGGSHDLLVLLEGLLDDRAEQILLRLEVAVDARAGDSHGGADVVDPRVVETVTVEELRRRREDHVPAGATTSRLRLWRTTRLRRLGHPYPPWLFLPEVVNQA